MTTQDKIYHGPLSVPCLVYSRIVGYLRPRSQGRNPMVNPGKYVEMLERLVYDVPKEGR